MPRATQIIRSATAVRVRDAIAREAFYREKLGFTSGAFWGKAPCFRIMRRDPDGHLVCFGQDIDPRPASPGL